MKKIETRREFVMANILEAGLMRPCDAAAFLKMSRQSVVKYEGDPLRVFHYEGVKYFSFLEVFELSITNDLKFDKRKVAKLREKQKVLHVDCIDLIKENSEL